MYAPLSDFFIICSEVRPTEGNAETVRVVIVKLTHPLNL